MTIDQETPEENKEGVEEHIGLQAADTKQIVRMNDNNKVIQRRQYARPTTNDVAKTDVTSFNPKQIEEKMRELYEKRDGVWRCLACDYTTTNNSSNIRRHVEKHISGLSYSCNLCEKEFRCKDSLYKHKKQCT